MSIPNNNFFRLPQQKFGTYGIQTGNAIHEILSEHNFEAKYDKDSKCIIVLHSSEIPPTFIEDILFKPSRVSAYKDWYPFVSHQTRCNGNLLIELIESSAIDQLQKYKSAEMQSKFILNGGQTQHIPKKRSRDNFSI